MISFKSFHSIIALVFVSFAFNIHCLRQSDNTSNILFIYFSDSATVAISSVNLIQCSTIGFYFFCLLLHGLNSFFDELVKQIYELGLPFLITISFAVSFFYFTDINVDAAISCLSVSLIIRSNHRPFLTFEQ